MQKCVVNITTTADGAENTIIREGKISLSESLVKLTYREENALICMELKENTARMERSGDYSLKLFLENDRILYSVTEDSLHAVLHYDLLIAGQRQKMRLNLRAKFVE